MSTFDFESNTESTQFTVNSVEEARSRNRLLASGTIVEVETLQIDGSFTYRCLFSDGTGTVDLLFAGRKCVPGMHLGTPCKVEGVVGITCGKRFVLDPFYQLLAKD